MKKILTLMAFVASTGAFAGGLLTNSNQNAAFLRNFAQEGQINLNSLYANPAGNAFLSPGWHFAITNQTAFQKRNITTTFPLFAYNQQTPGNQTHEFRGNASAPVIPSFTISHNWERWSLSAHFALGGGGGKCEFDNGLGSFEALYGSKIMDSKAAIESGVNQGLPAMVAATMTAAPYNLPATQAQALAATGTYSNTFSGYGLDSYMKGRSYYFGLQIGGAYKINDNVSAYIGIRGVYATCNYNGYVQDVKALTNYSYSIPAIPGAFPGAQGNGTYATSLDEKSLSMNCDQTGFGVTPIFGLDWKINDKWNVAVKYEANTRMSLKNHTEMNDYTKLLATKVLSDGTENASYNATLGQFADGKSVREDIPAIIALGAEYKPLAKVRLDGAWKMYFDKTSNREDKEGLIDHNTWELAFGAEYDINKWVTVSASWQRTCYGLSDEYMNDLSFNLSNNSIGLGVRVNATSRLSFDLGYMHTIYGNRTVNTDFGNNITKTDVYSRKNDVIGIGINYDL